MNGLYIHFPFCTKKCIYCDFFSGLRLNEDLNKLYFSSLEKEIELYKILFLSKKFDTLYLGGGTPSLISLNSLKKLFSTLFDSFSFNKNPEITIEVNPEDVTLEKAKVWKDLGINRVSLGWQSFDDKILHFFNRNATVYQNKKAFEILKTNGFLNISVDVILGTFERKDPILKEGILAYKPEHVSAYMLGIEKGTKLYHMLSRREYQAIPDQKMVFLYQDMVSTLVENGYDWYEVSSFAKKGYKSVHNQIYWDYNDYLGLGMGASGSFSQKEKIRYTNVKNIYKYNSLVKENTFPYLEKEILDKNKQLEEIIMLNLRKREGLDINLLKSYLTKLNLQKFLNFIDNSFSKDLELKNDHIIVKKDKVLFLNDLIISLWSFLEKID